MRGVFAPIVVTTPNNGTMHAKKVSHKIIDNACTWMQAAQRNVVAEGKRGGNEELKGPE
jgi:hypothetical protein